MYMVHKNKEMCRSNCVLSLNLHSMSQHIAWALLLSIMSSSTSSCTANSWIWIYQPSTTTHCRTCWSTETSRCMQLHMCMHWMSFDVTHNYLHKHTCTSHQQGQPHPPFLLLCLSGEPPSVVVVTSITEVMQGGVQVMWMAPNVTNGVILSYTVEVRLLTEGGHTVYASNYTVTVGGMPPSGQSSACIRSYTAISACFPHTISAYAAVSGLVRCPTSDVDFSFQYTFVRILQPCTVHTVAVQ